MPLQFNSLDELASQFTSYPSEIVPLFQVLKDQIIKKELIDLDVIDGGVFGMNSYFITGKLEKNNVSRIIVPIHMDGAIDLPW